MKYKFSSTALEAGEVVLMAASPEDIATNPNTVIANIVDAVLEDQRNLILAEPADWPNYEIPLSRPIVIT